MKLHIGTYFETPLYIHWSWFLLPLLIGIFYGPASVITLIAAFLFVTLHEYGHCFMAKRLGLKVKDVTLLPIGGVAEIHFNAGNYKQELLIAIAGPIVNFFLAFIFILLIFVVPNEALVFCAAVNLFVGAFNLFLPIIPMDGGRVLRASLTWITGNFRLATLISVRLAQILCVCLIFLGFYLANPWMAMIFLFMLLASQNELVAANHYTSVHTIKWKIGLALKRPELADAPLSEVIAALEDVEDNEVKDFLQIDSLVPVLRDIDESKSA